MILPDGSIPTVSRGSSFRCNLQRGMAFSLGPADRAISIRAQNRGSGVPAGTHPRNSSSSKDSLDSTHMKNRNPLALAVLTATAGIAAIGWLATSAGATISVTTPPKGDQGGKAKTSAEGQPTAASPQRTAAQSGTSEVMWFAALRQVQVTNEQRETITPLVRYYLEKSKAWRETEGLALKKFATDIKRIRDVGLEPSPELMATVKSLRMNAPRLRVLQDTIAARLTSTQMESLSKKIVEIKRARAKAAREARATPVKGATGSADELQGSSPKPKENPSVGGAGKDDPKKSSKAPGIKKEVPWSFVK